ncbi:MAG TPA: S-layer homology domain-containing protein, partial [Candidatus Gracilibacteria bacterium]|nr:S-layer homology domain-containing protein [Candidatus Gracilibacteria bacterium]
VIEDQQQDSLILLEPTDPTVYCNFTPSSPKAGDTVTFTATAAGFNINSNANFNWTGTVTGPGATKTKQFSSAGTFTATVTGSYYSDVLSESDTDSCTVQVSAIVVEEQSVEMSQPEDSNLPINSPQNGVQDADDSQLYEPAVEEEQEEDQQQEQQQQQQEEQEEVTVQSESAELQNAQELLTCSFSANSTVALDNVESIIAECKLDKNARLFVEVIQGEFDPEAELSESDIVKVIQEEESKDAKTYLFTWNLKDKFDSTVEAGDYSMVVGARATTNYNYDYSLRKIKVVENSSEIPSETQETGEATETQDTATETTATGTEQAPATEAPKEEPKAEPSQCPGVNYPTDIEGHWAADFIKKAYDLCLIGGYEDGTFRPNQPVTRAEAVKMVLAGAGVKPIEGCYDADCGSPFGDLDMWQGPWVRAAWDQKMVEGYAGNIMGPNYPMTRAEAAALLAKAFKVPPHEGCYTANCGAGHPDNFFLDIVDMWQGPWLRALWDKGWINGTAPNKFEPNRAITRAELSKLIQTALEKK